MKVEELSEEVIETARSIYWDRSIKWDERMSKLIKLFGKSERTVRYWCSNKLGFKNEIYSPVPISEQYKVAKERVLDNKKRFYLVTWAQNNTPIHRGFFNNLKAYASFLDGDIHVIPGRYKNPTSVFADKKEEFWDKETIPYLDANRNDFAENITIFGDIKIEPTAVNPFSDLQGLCYMTGCIFGSPKIQLQSIPVIQGNNHRIMLTTGACTVKNYTDSKAGKKGEFHHTYGAVIIEVGDNNKVFFRQITAKENGDFNDLYWNVSKGNVSRNDKIEAIIYGDLHAGEHDQNVLDVTEKMILDKLHPNTICLHDVFSGKSINPHENKDPFLLYGKQLKSEDDLSSEIKLMLDIIGKFRNKGKEIVIVRSNHDDFLCRWVKNEDWKKQPSFKNSRVYMKLSDMLLKQYEENPNNIKGLIPELINQEYPEYITLGLNDSYIVGGFEIGMHGHVGVNGAKGSPESFRKLNTKMISGHTHSAFRKDGLLVCGTSTRLRLGYNTGPSSWSQGHVIIDKYGKAQNIIFINGEFTTFSDT